MSVFILTGIQKGKAAELNSGCWLILFQPEQTPPHLMLCLEGKIFGISASGKQNGSQAEKLLSYAERKKNGLICIELFVPAPIDALEIASSCFSRYIRLEAGKTSCLNPIRDFTAMIWGNELNNARFVFELIPALEFKKAVGKKLAFQLPLDQNDFALPLYDEATVADVIRVSAIA
jgi:hypothetical protein